MSDRALLEELLECINNIDKNMTAEIGWGKLYNKYIEIRTRMVAVQDRKIITVLGSTKFRLLIKLWAWEQTQKGFLVLFAPFCKEELIGLEEYRDEIEFQHFQKIRMADEIFVYNKDGYIGDSVKLEIQYAESIGKIIKYLEEKKDGT